MAGHHRLDPTDPDLMSVPEAGRRLGYSRDHAYKLAASGDLPGAKRVGKGWRVSVRVFERYLHEETSGFEA